MSLGRLDTPVHSPVLLCSASPTRGSPRWPSTAQATGSHSAAQVRHAQPHPRHDRPLGWRGWEPRAGCPLAFLRWQQFPQRRNPGLGLPGDWQVLWPGVRVVSAQAAAGSLSGPVLRAAARAPWAWWTSCCPRPLGLVGRILGAAVLPHSAPAVWHRTGPAAGVGVAERVIHPEAARPLQQHGVAGLLPRRPVHRHRWGRRQGGLLRVHGQGSWAHPTCFSPLLHACLQVKVWNTLSGFCFVTFTEHSSGVTGVTFTATGYVIVTSSMDGTVRAFDLHR